MSYIAKVRKAGFSTVKMSYCGWRLRKGKLKTFRRVIGRNH